MSEQEKMFYTLAEAEEHLHITSTVLARKILYLNIETRSLPGSRKVHIATRDVKLIEQSIKAPSSIA